MLKAMAATAVMVSCPTVGMAQVADMTSRWEREEGLYLPLYPAVALNHGAILPCPFGGQ